MTYELRGRDPAHSYSLLRASLDEQSHNIPCIMEESDCCLVGDLS